MTNELDTLRHSAAHILAHAVKRLYPDVRLGIGPAIENGFYYDFLRQAPFTPEDLSRIEQEMRTIVGEDHPFTRTAISREKALTLFPAEPLKRELIEELSGEDITIYTSGEFTDLCKGPHVAGTGAVRVFKLLSVAGAYWRGNENNPMLQRIYGTAFLTQGELDTYLRQLEEAAKRDHRKLGRELDLFSMQELIGPGLVLYHPKGAMLRSLVEDFIRQEHLKRGYELVISPHIMRSDIWKTSGHYDYYRENMYFFPLDEQECAIKPMNCPGHILVYRSSLRSYKELPIRYFELGTVYRHEKSGVLHGLLRVRGFTQDDAHIFCLPEQIEEEIMKVIDFVVEVLGVFGFSGFEVEVSTRPPKSIGRDEDWARAENALKAALQTKGIPFVINEGEGAFYGPKIDIKLKDAIGRAWQCATIQCDFALPERFALKYIDRDGKEARPIMLHRVILGSIERFLGALIEHYGGAFPLWLAPVQVAVIPISDDQGAYAAQVEALMRQQGIRVSVDRRPETMQKKIREAETQKIPYMVIIGKRELANNTVSVRSKAQGDRGAMTVEALLKDLAEEIHRKGGTQ